MDDRTNQRPHVLLVTRNLPPLQGGMERLVGRMAGFLSENYSLSVIGPKGCGAFLPSDVRVLEVEFRSLGRFLIEVAHAIIKIARQKKFDIVIAGSGLTAPLAWAVAVHSRALFVTYLHGLDIVAPSVVYQHCWVPFFRRAKLVLVNSRNTRKLALARGVPEEVIRVLHPGTELPDLDMTSRRQFRAAQRLGERPLLLSVGRLTARKGLVEFIGRCMPLILEKQPDAILLVVGADAQNAVNSGSRSETERILQAAAQVGVASSVRILPPCDDLALAAAYRATDVHIFPVLDLPGDVEGFGMVAIEAAAHGLPTVGFSVGGVPDAIVEGKTGSLVRSGDYADFADRVLQWLGAGTAPPFRENCIAEASAFGWGRFRTQLYEHLLGAQRRRI